MLTADLDMIIWARTALLGEAISIMGWSLIVSFKSAHLYPISFLNAFQISLFSLGPFLSLIVFLFLILFLSQLIITFSQIFFSSSHCRNLIRLFPCFALSAISSLFQSSFAALFALTAFMDLYYSNLILFDFQSISNAMNWRKMLMI